MGPFNIFVLFTRNFKRLGVYSGGSRPTDKGEGGGSGHPDHEIRGGVAPPPPGPSPGSATGVNVRAVKMVPCERNSYPDEFPAGAMWM